MKNQHIIGTLIIGLSIVITGALLGRAFKQRNVNQDTISVAGLGKKDFTSDEMLFSGYYTAKAMEAKEAYAIIIADKEKVKNFFMSKGFKPNEVVFSGVDFEKTYKTVEIQSQDFSKASISNTKTEQTFDGYIAKQSVTISCKKNPELMKRIEDVADQTSELINSGIEFNPNQIQYTYSDLPGLKHDLIEKATQDAKERAQKTVKTAGGNLGKLKMASLGVFQITGQGSVSEDTYSGNNDIYSKEKSARIVVRLEYQLD
ncbi:SIMPL domain-containing protein [Chitinophagaceae bacterium MMS25-I14]